MDIITQTNRTILFEEVNPEKLDLLTLVGSVKGIDSLKDEKIDEINSNLLVKSFDDFLGKFEPTVYYYYNAANQKVNYSLQKPENIPANAVGEVKLDENNDFLKMLFTLIDTKKDQGTKNVDFKFENVLDMISPKKIMEDIKMVRKEINYLHTEYSKLEEEDPSKLEIGDKLNLKFEQASQNYNNVLGMLPLAIEDIKTRLLLGQNQEESEATPIEIGVLDIGEDGELKILEAPKEEEQALTVQDDGTRDELIEVFEEDYEEITDNSNPYVKSLVTRTFAPLTASSVEIDVEKEVQNYNTYLQFYKDSKDDFVKVAKPLIEKLLGIKMFFEQYDTKNQLMRPELLITNTKLDMLVKSNNKPRLETFFNTVNGKNDFDETIWFGIVPAIDLDESSGTKIRRNRFKGTKKEKKSSGNTLESLTAILNVAKDYKIQIFFNFDANDKTTFNNMATMGVEKYINKTSKLTKQDYSEYAIPCLPNFTVIPKDKSGVVLDRKMKEIDGGATLSKEKEDILKLWLEGIYIDAAYVAAGITAAYQCPEYLKQRFKKVSKKIPGVRFDLESGDNGLLATTTLAKEISGFTNNIKQKINRQSFGFVFSSDNAQVKDKQIKRITVYKARSLSMNDDGFDSIYKTLVSTYVERMLRFRSSDFKQDKIVKFFSNNPSSQRSKWEGDMGSVNSLLQVGDDIGYEIDLEENRCKLNLMFNGNMKNLEVDITKSTSK
ncbi:MAG: transcriptional regulator [Fusobacteriota bacterium]